MKGKSEKTTDLYGFTHFVRRSFVRFPHFQLHNLWLMTLSIIYLRLDGNLLLNVIT